MPRKNKKELDPLVVETLKEVENLRKSVIKGKALTNEQRAVIFDKQYDLLTLLLFKSILTEEWGGTLNTSTLLDRVREQKVAWCGSGNVSKDFRIIFDVSGDSDE